MEERMERLGIIAHPDTGERVGYVWKTGNAYAAGSHLGYFETEEAAVQAVQDAARGRALAAESMKKMNEAMKKMNEAEGNLIKFIEELVAEGKAVPICNTEKPAKYVLPLSLAELEAEGKIERRELWVLDPAQPLPHSSQKR